MRQKAILSVAYPFAAVGPAAVGGAEQVLHSVERALVDQGWQSWVVAAEGSVVAGKLLPTRLPPGVIDEEVRLQVVAAHQQGIDRSCAAASIDLVHLHGIDFHLYRIPEHIPVLVTLHLPPSWYPASVWQLPARFHLQCVSESQLRACPAAVRDRLLLVENGVDLDIESDVADEMDGARDVCLMLSRICPEKNLHVGLDAARRAGVPAVLCGETFGYETHLQYLREQIEPRLGKHARLLGAVGRSRKQALLAGARCLLLPTLAPETSSLVAMEALAAGTPVIAFPSGALPEIIEHQRTGFLVRDEQEMAEAIARVAELDRSACRRVAEARFGRERMIARYFAVIDNLLAAKPGPAMNRDCEAPLTGQVSA